MSSTPMMKQYNELKEKVAGKLLFFRMGDFYELFGQDAKIAAPILGIALTARDKKSKVPMCGIPFHAVSSYIFKLTNAGYSVAIGEQIEDPKKAKGIVKRSIVKIVTPSLVYDSDIIDNKKPSYLMSVFKGKNCDSWSYAYLDYTTGEFKASSINGSDKLLKEISTVNPNEVIFDKEIPKVIYEFLKNTSFTSIKENKLVDINNVFNKLIVDSRLSDEEICACKNIFYYLYETQFTLDFPHIKSIKRIISSEFMSLDEFTIRNLEITETLLPTIDKTISPMGGRFLRTSILQPLSSKEKIENRLSMVECFINNFNLLEKTRDILKSISDVPRLISKIALNSYRPIEFKKLLESLLSSNKLSKELNNTILPSLDINTKLNDFCNNTIKVFNDTLPNSVNDSGIFKLGFNEKLDELIQLHENSRKYLFEMEKNEREKSKINSLKIKYNKVFGYYIEISNANLSLVPEHYQRKQTLVNGERYTTEELNMLEVKLLSAQEERKNLEKTLFENLRIELVENFIDSINSYSNYVQNIDLYQCFAWQALYNNYSKPNINSEYDLILNQARHPVMETILKKDYIPNDITIKKDGFFHIITGPNMAGKSTLMRTVAQIVIMAHMGSYVSATSASIPITDKVFTRVGATDYILKGQSTFMVEMIETANIIHSASSNSLIILDEIGRGTSTYDGISIAWALAEYIHNQIGSKCLFATHYHELCDLENSLQGVSNYSMAVKEKEEGLFFLRKLIKKPASSSYGIQVAQMAGIPKSIINRAFKIMNKFNLQRKDNILSIEKEQTNQLNLFDDDNQKSYKLIKEIDSLNINNITPIDALNRIYEWKKNLEE